MEISNCLYIHNPQTQTLNKSTVFFYLLCKHQNSYSCHSCGFNITFICGSTCRGYLGEIPNHLLSVLRLSCSRFTALKKKKIECNTNPHTHTQFSQINIIYAHILYISSKIMIGIQMKCAVWLFKQFTLNKTIQK